MRKGLLVFVIGLFAALGLCSQDVTFRCEAPQVVGLHERFRVSFVVSSDKPSDFVPPTFQGVNFLGGPSQSRTSSTNIVNGKRTSSGSTTFTYWLQSLTTGTITIAPAQIKVGGKVYTTKRTTIRVEKDPSMSARAQNNPSARQRAQQPAPTVKVIDDKAVFVRAIPSKTKVVKGEEIVISYKIYTLVPISEYQVDKFPSSQGFWVEELSSQPTPQLEREIIDGKAYQTATLRQVLVYPQKSGTLHIQPMGLEVVAHLQTGVSRRQRVSTGDPFFDAFFNDPFFAGATPIFEKVNKKLKTNALTIEVEDLPKSSSDFSGAVGRFELSSSIDTSFSRTNEAITLTYTISGKGNLSLIDALDLTLPDEFEFYDPNITDNLTKTPAGQSGSRTFQYVIIPRVEGNYTIPALEFTYFDPVSREYKTLRSDEYKLNIKKGKNDNGFAQQMSEREKYRNMDIKDFAPSGKGRSFVLLAPFSSPWLYVVIAALVAALLVSIRLKEKQLAQRADVVSTKLRRAGRVAAKRLKKAAKYLENGDSEAFATEIGQALWAYMSDKFKIPTTRLSLENIERTLRESNLEQEVLDYALETLSECEYVRFSPSKDTADYRELYTRTLKTITDMETTLQKPRKEKGGMRGAIVLLAFCLIGSALASQDLGKANELYSKGEYPEALTIYQKALEQNPNAQTLHAIANTYFRMSDYANGILYYERALRLSPNDKQLNIDYNVCRSRLMGEVYRMPDFFLLRFFKNVANLLAPMAWAIVFCVLFALCLAAFFLYRFSLERKVALFYVCLALFVLSIAAFSLGLCRERMVNNRDYAIVFSSEVPLRSDRGADKEGGTRLFKGQKVKVLDTTGKEVYVRTEDGKQGWIDKKIIKII